jgi:hypothetical protein
MIRTRILWLVPRYVRRRRTDIILVPRIVAEPRVIRLCLQPYLRSFAHNGTQ